MVLIFFSFIPKNKSRNFYLKHTSSIDLTLFFFYTLKIMSSSLQNETKEFFQSKHGIAALYLFGSEAKGKATSSSDVDIAILYESNSIPSSLEAIEIQSELESKLHREVDLTILNKSNPILKHQVFKKGVLLLANDRKFLNNFFVKSLMEYDDLKRVRAIVESSILKGRIYGG